jgi:hypothetical protein
MNPRYVPGWLVAAFLLCLFALLTSGFDVSEGVEHAEWARSMMQTGELGLTAPMSPNWVKSQNARYYSAHEIGNAVALVPFVWTASNVGLWSAGMLGRPELGALLEGSLLPLVAALYVALTCLAFYRLSVDVLDARPTTAIVAAAALGTTTILLPYSRMLFDGVLGGMLIAWALVWADRAAARGDWVRAAFAGLALGCALATRQTLAVFAVPVVAMLMCAPSRQRLRLIGAFALAMMPALLWQAWYNAVRTGTFYVPAVALPQFQNLSADGDMVEGFVGLLVSPGKSLFIYSPLLLLSVVGLRSFVQRRRLLAVGLAVAVVVYMLVHASIRNWSGEWGWGPRYLVPLTLPLALPAVVVLERARRSGGRLLRWAAIVIVATGLLVQVIGMTTNWHYRYSWLWQNGRFDIQTLAWSIKSGELVETTRMLIENVARAAGRDVPIRLVDGASAATTAASNTINVWAMTAAREGVPVLLVVLACAALALIASFAAGLAVRTARELESSLTSP